MKTTPWIVATLLIITMPAAHAGLLDALGLGRRTPTNVTSGNFPSETLSQDQIVLGLKEALGQGVQQAVNRLGHDGGFLTNMNVRIPIPEKLQRVERTLRALKQDKLADDFEAAMNHAAEQAVPEAVSVFEDSIRSMTIEDASRILLGTNNAATQYFRRTTETNLHARFLPIVKRATDKSGATAAYKQLMESVGAGNSSLGSIGRALLGNENVDLDQYVTSKALDGLFKMVADEEKRIRQNPAARTSVLLQKVFGALGR